MSAQTLKADRENIHYLVEQLPDNLIQRIRGYIERVYEEDIERKAEEEERRYQNMTVEEIHAEIDALHEKYGMTPNAETIAAMKEAEEDGGEIVTIEEIRARCNAIR